MKRSQFFALILLLILMAPTANADFKKSPWTRQKGYMDKTAGKIGFGLNNLTMGWCDLWIQPKEHGFFKGLGRGIGKTVTNTAGGLIHIATFPIPLDVPLPDGGVQFERQHSLIPEEDLAKLESRAS